VPRLSASGEFLGMVGTSFDVTERHRIEEELAEANRRKDEFLAVLSHELRNPLAPIRSSLSVLSRAELDSAQARRMHDIIERQVTHLSRLVDDLLDVTRITRGKIQLHREQVELGELIRRTVEDHRTPFETHGVHLSATVASNPLWVQADVTRIVQLVGNLLGNALKFTSRGGRVDVSLAPADNDAVLTVRDTGVGISPAMLGRLFQPFVQGDRSLDRAHGGLGLGLALVKGLAELHGGTVIAESDGLGSGATFTVRLPLRDAPVQATRDEVHEPLTPRRVLVIEDNVDAATALQEALALDGHDVQVAYDGAAGLAAARRFDPEVVLCDIGLPGMDGYEVARAFRSERNAERPFLVALSGYALPEDLQRAREAGFDAHVAKPPTLEQLEHLIVSVPSRPYRPQADEPPPTLH